MERGNSSGTSAAETLLDCCGMPAEHGPTSTYDWAAVSAAVCVDLLQQIRCHAGDRYFRRLLWSGRTHVTLERGSMQSSPAPLVLRQKTRIDCGALQSCLAAHFNSQQQVLDESFINTNVAHGSSTA